MSDTEKTEKDVAVEKKKKKGLGPVRWALIVICAGLAIFSGWKLLGIMEEYQEGDDTYNEVEDTAFVPVKPKAQGEEDDEVSIIPEIDFVSLKGISNNAVGWLFNPGSVINYPVAKTTDNSYYIDHMIDGSYNSNGCLFIDYRNQDGLADRNTILYGHRMKNGKMLSSIAQYAKQAYYDAHPVMYYITEDARYILEIFSAYTTNATSDSYTRNFKDDAAFSSWLKTVTRRSYIKTEVTPTAEDTIITLSTCVKTNDLSRFVVHVRVVKIEEPHSTV